MHLPSYQDLMQISSPFKGILLDAHGVFWGGGGVGLLPGSKEMMERLIVNGKVVGVLSNSTQLAAKEIDKLQRHGLELGKHFHFFMTSGEAARAIFLKGSLPFKTPRNKFWLFGEAHPKYSSHEAIFKESKYTETREIDEADFIYISIPHIAGEDQTDPEVFRSALAAIQSKRLPKVCPNPDQFAHEGNPPRAVVRQGSIARLYEEMNGQVFYIGKPHSKVFSLAFEHFCKHKIEQPSDILMVGDTPETDIRGARGFGMRSSLILQTGIMSDRIARRGLQDALNALPPQDRPDYFIQRFCP